MAGTRRSKLVAWPGRHARLAAIGILAFALSGALCAQTPQTVQRLTQYGHKSWQVQDGQFSSANGIAQTQDGYLWLASDGGLIRFDGVRFVAQDVLADGPAAPRIALAVLGARDGSLWTVIGRQLIQLKDGRRTSYTMAGKVSQLAEDDSGALWIAQTRTAGRGGPLCRVANGKFACFGPPELPLPYASALEVDKAGGVWIGGSMGLCRWSQGQPAACHLQDVLKPHAGLTGVTTIHATRDGTLWVGMGKSGRDLGLGQFADGRWKPFFAAGLDGSSLSVSSLMEDRDGALWVGTLDQGLYRIQGGRAEHFGRADGLSSDTISGGGLYQDREGTVWVITSLGLDAFRPLPVSVFSTREGLPADAVDSVLAARDGTVWFGDQTLAIWANGEIGPAPHAELFRGKEVTSLLEDHAGRLWIGLDTTLNVFENGVLRPISGPDGGAMGAIERIAEDPDHDVWVTLAGAPTKLLRIRNSGVVERMDGKGSIPAGLDLLALTANPKGGILVGLRNGGVAAVHGTEVESLAAEPISNATVVGLHADADGTILASTLKGLLVLRGPSRQLLDVAHGLPCDQLRTVVRDRQADLWIRGNCGIMRIAAAELERWLARPASRIEARLFDVTDGVRPGNPSFMPMTSVGPDGRVWFANGKVAQVIDPASAAQRRPAPAVRIEQVTADRSVLEPGGSISLPARTRDIELRYTALSFIAPQKIKFRYRLEGRDATWTDADTRRQVFYTDLPPGHYRFRVIACNADGVWNETGATQDFEIPPLFYQTKWFVALCILGAALALYGFYVFRLRQVASRVRERVAAKNAERERIARELHDTLLQSTEGLILQFHTASNSIPSGNPAREALKKALDRADEVVAEGRDRVQDLRTSDSPLGELSQALAALGEELTRDTGTAFRTIVEGEARDLDPTVADETYRIGREALLNARRHAGAREIEVQIIYEDSDFRMRIRDDGAGIDTGTGDGSVRPGHWGLKGMRERAEKIGARFDLWSRPGAGTEIELRVPAALAYRKRPSRLRWLAGWRLAAE